MNLSRFLYFYQYQNANLLEDHLFHFMFQISVAVQGNTYVIIHWSVTTKNSYVTALQTAL